MVDRSRVMIDARKWLASKLAPKKGGAMGGGVYMERPKAEEHFFGTSEDEKVLPHVGKALGLKGPKLWHASRFTREVPDGLLPIGFVHQQQIIWDTQRTVLTRTLYWFQHEPCWFVRQPENVPQT